MENAEEVMQILERFTRLKQKEIPKELDDYLQFVAKTGDTVFKWANLKYLFREKLLNVITHFYDTTPRMDEIPQYPNVDPFNYESMKSSLLERLEHFNAAPFTIQRLCELLIDPKKQYNRIDKFMRALEKNILVSTVEPGRKRTESENGDSLDSVVNGDISLDVNVDIDMENESLFNMEAAQNGNGTAAVVSPVGANEKSNDTTEGVNDKKPEVESDIVVKVATTIHEAPTQDDEDLQPSPKKAKLDTAVDAAAVAAVDASTKPVKKIEAAAEKKGEVATDDVVVASEAGDEKKIEEKASVKSDSQVEINGVDEKSEGATEKSEKSEKDKEEIKTERKVEAAEVASPTVTAKCEKKQIEAVVELNSKKDVDTAPTATAKVSNEKHITKEKSEVDSGGNKEDAKLDEISSAVEQNEQKEAAEKIIEKQEIEKCEKSAAKELPTNVDAATHSENEKSIDPKSEKDAKNAAKVEQEAIAKTNNEAEVATKVVESPKETTVAADATVKASSAVENVADKFISSSSTASTVAKAKTDDIETSVTTTEDVKSVNAAPEATEAAIPAITSTSTTSEASLVKENKATSEAAATVTTAINEELPAVKTDVVVEKPSTAESTATEATIAAAPVAAVAAIAPPPSISLNDQPMDEDAIANVVDEIVMSESITTTTGDAVEMATDAMEATVASDAAKIDEATDGMEVDDTSPQQEAMDQ